MQADCWFQRCLVLHPGMMVPQLSNVSLGRLKPLYVCMYVILIIIITIIITIIVTPIIVVTIIIVIIIIRTIIIMIHIYIYTYIHTIDRFKQRFAASAEFFSNIASQLGHPGHLPGDTIRHISPLKWWESGELPLKWEEHVELMGFWIAPRFYTLHFHPGSEKKSLHVEGMRWLTKRFPRIWPILFILRPIHKPSEWSLSRSICVDLDGQQPLSCSCPVSAMATAPFRSMRFPCFSPIKATSGIIQPALITRQYPLVN